jgi:hypothetical protein
MIFNTFTQSLGATQESGLSYKQTYNLNTNSYFSPETLLLTHNLSKVNYALNKLYDTKRIENFLQSTKVKMTTPIDFLLYETIDFNYSEVCE